MSFNTIGELVNTELNGKVRNYTWRKTPSQVTTSNIWFDLSMSPGMPTPKYWFDATPLTAKAITQSDDGGFYHGPNVSPSNKYLRVVTTQMVSSGTTNASPCNALLCDYLLYYPSIDDGTTDPQLMDNSVSLPRYIDGKGVQIVAITTGARTGGQQFTISYTNQDGVSGRTTPVVTQNAFSAIGTITCSATATANATNPFIPLQNGDYGVRSIESVTMLGSDVGLFSLILVKPLCQTIFRESTTTAGVVAVPYEKDFLIHANTLPQIYDNAFLNFLLLPSNSLASSTLTGNLKVIWD